MNNEIPTVTSELERKTLDLLEQLAYRVSVNRMDEQDFCMISQALWNITSGLVDKSVSNMCSQGAENLKGRVSVRYFAGKGLVMKIQWAHDWDGYKITSTNVNTMVQAVKTSPVEIVFRGEALDKLFALLATNGYVEL